MPFSVLIIEKHPMVRSGLEQFFSEQFNKDDRVVSVGEAAEFNMIRLTEGQNLDLIVCRFPISPQDEVRNALYARSLFSARFYETTGDPLENHMLSCHSGDLAIAIDDPNWGAQLAKRAKEFLCSQLVNGGLDALFNERDHHHPASPYEGRFRRFFVHGRGLTRALSELIGVITDYWNFLDERTQKRVQEQFHIDLDHKIDGQKYPIFVTLRRQQRQID